MSALNIEEIETSAKNWFVHDVNAICILLQRLRPQKNEVIEVIVRLCQEVVELLCFIMQRVEMIEFKYKFEYVQYKYTDIYIINARSSGTL